ncbi:hypothetical protein PSTG_06839 [Puccinia striiformis f. sp. tritici PST-78]|uniref:Uncharacterized protein n=1 Tax=Puccinia striiformis f. sp. tritici PST-78 TaxID=1165861 RepID=A0A0L0VL41_9BASI|nr:hypothetical protein PSTG_06839 [Puccinia striiformis f. sp. tritici PST-78]
METQLSSSLEPLGQITKASSQLSTQLDELLDSQSTDNKVSASSGISLLDLKNHLLTSYLHNLTNLLIIRISQNNGILKLGKNQEESLSNRKIVEQLVWLRLVFERLRPMEARLKYQIDKLIKTVQELDHHSFSNPNAAIDHVMNDPLSFRPNPAALEGANDTAEDDESGSIDNGRNKEEQRSTEVYRPPRVAPVAYPETKSAKTKRVAPAPIALREHVSLSTRGPQPESTTGLSNTVVKSSNRAKALARMNEYEESNMTRLFSTKKDAKRRKNDEANIALGIQTSATNKNVKRKLGALEGEFDGVLSEINRSSDRYDHHLGGPSSSSKHNRPNKNLASAEDGNGLFSHSSSNGNRKFKKKGAFDKAIKKISNK